MLSEEITSGELYYHVETGHGQASIADSKSYSQVRSFLRRDNKEVEDGSIKIRQTRKLLLQSRAAKVQHLDEALMELISNRVEHKMLAAHREMMDLNQKIRLYKQQFDHCALQSVLQYASVLQQEIIEANTLLQQERLMKDSLKDQASLTREFKTYCAHLKLETKGKIELTALSSNSAQFVRCVKAVHDNLNNCFGFGNTAPMLPTPQNVNIINVFKLKNSFLAKAMQKSASKAAGAKMKGFFCCMPVENIYRFAIQGLAEQAFPGTSSDSSADLSLYFSPPWIFADQQPLVPLISDMMNVLDQAGLAQRASSKLVTRPSLRFSKYSTVSTLMSYSEGQLQKGVCLALCRVLMVRVKNVSGFIEDADLVAAMQQGYDAVYSTLSEEYALLQPNFVLPEFFIHADFTSLRQSTFIPLTQQQSKKSTLPSYLQLPLENVKKIEVADPNVRILYDRTTIPPAVGMLLSNHFNLVRIQTGLDNLISENKLENTNGSMSPSRSPTKRENPQRNVMIKQSALIAIENAVDEFRRVIPTAFLDSASRLRSTI